MAARPAAIRLEGVGKRYGPVQALDGLSLTVAPGEIVGIAGPNGAGKTTAIRILLGLEKADAGTVEVLGRSIPRERAKVAARIGYMPQNEALYPDLTVRENLMFFARLQGVAGRAARRSAVEEAVRFVSLSHRADDTLGRLSGGMRRRVSLAAALLHDPELAVLDEPTVGVDPELRQTMWDGFREFARTGSALLLSTHYMGEADACDRVVFVRDGRVVADGPPGRLKDHVRRDTGGGAGVDLEAAFRHFATRQGGA